MAKKGDLRTQLNRVKRGVSPEKVETSDQSGAREGKGLVSGWFSLEVRKQLKMLAVEKEMTVQGLLSEALNLLFERYKKPPIS